MRRATLLETLIIFLIIFVIDAIAQMLANNRYSVASLLTTKGVARVEKSQP